MTGEPAHFALDGRVLDVVEHESGAHALEQVARGRCGDRAADAADERRTRLGLGIEGLDGFFDLLGAGDADLGFVQLADRRIELDRLDGLFVELLPGPVLRERSRRGCNRQR